MGAISLKKHFVFFLLALSIAVVHTRPLSKWHIHVVNGLSNGQTLSVHCQSSDDDLGQHNLGSGAEFNWTFRVNLWDTTLFWCYLSKPKAQVSFEAFWVEKKSTWLSDRCNGKNCIWTAQDHGIYLKDNRFNTDELIYPWKFAGEEKN